MTKTAQKLDVLDRLIGAVEAGIIPHEPGLVYRALAPGGYGPANRRDLDLIAAFNGSLDAALALHNALLPGWEWNVSWVGASVGGPNASPAETPDVVIFADNSKIPARAWLLAILKAYCAQVAQQTA